MSRPRKASLPPSPLASLVGTRFVGLEFESDTQHLPVERSALREPNCGCQPPSNGNPEPELEQELDHELQACLTEIANAHIGLAGRGYDLRHLVKNPLLRDRIVDAIREALADLKFHQCDSCGNWIVIGAACGFAKATKHYCDGACRQREYMKRQRAGAPT